MESGRELWSVWASGEKRPVRRRTVGGLPVGHAALREA